jgi:Putative Ig domain
LTHVIRARALVLAAGLMLAALAACTGGSSYTTPGVGTGVTIGLASPTGTAQIYLTQSVTLSANVLDGSSEGVTWTVAGPGKLSDITKNTVVYTAPSVTVEGTNITAGATTATITATEVHNPLYYSSISIIANGAPQIPPTILLPANQNIPYSTIVNVIGGTAPFTFSISAGALPPGLALNDTGGPQAGISGTPITINHSPPPFTLTATDTNGAKASITLTLPVNEQTGCVLTGRYLFLQNGYAFDYPAARAVSVFVNTNGTLSGIQDYKRNGKIGVGETFTGQCANDGGNRGHVQFNATSATIFFNYAMFSDLVHGDVIQNDGTSFYGVGALLKQSVPAPTLATIAGDFVFGLVGADSSNVRKAAVGRLTLSSTGAVSNGKIDINGSGPIAGAALTGNFTAPDAATGRGTAILTFAGRTLHFIYYAPAPDTVYLLDVDSAANAPRLAGPMNRQDPTVTYDATAMAGTGVIQLQGSTGTTVQHPSTELGRRCAVESAATCPQPGLTLDSVIDGTPDVLAILPETFAVDASGRVVYTVGSGATLRRFIIYLDGVNDGYLIEATGDRAGFGRIDAQDSNAFANFSGGSYIGVTLFPSSISPMALLPGESIGGGTLGGNIPGYYALDPVTGRAVSFVSRNILGGSGAIFYLISATTDHSKVVMMGNGVQTVSSVVANFAY